MSDKTAITYHRATVADAAILADYRIRFALELSGPQPEENISRLRTQMLDFFSSTVDSSCISVIAKCGSQIAGIGSVHLRNVPGNFKNPTGRWGYIMNMYTVPEFRRRGICKGILDELVNAGKTAGITAFELHATVEGEPVYSKNGFTIHNEPTYRKFLL